MNLGNRALEILAWVKKHPGQSTRTIAEHVHGSELARETSRMYTGQVLAVLVGLGLVERSAPKRPRSSSSDPYYLYREGPMVLVAKEAR